MLKMYTLNTKASFKIIKQRVIANFPKKEVKWNHKKKSHPREEKYEKASKAWVNK